MKILSEYMDFYDLQHRFSKSDRIWERKSDRFLLDVDSQYIDPATAYIKYLDNWYEIQGSTLIHLVDINPISEAPEALSKLVDIAPIVVVVPNVGSQHVVYINPPVYKQTAILNFLESNAVRMHKEIEMFLMRKGVISGSTN